MAAPVLAQNHYGAQLSVHFEQAIGRKKETHFKVQAGKVACRPQGAKHCPARNFRQLFRRSRCCGKFCDGCWKKQGGAVNSIELAGGSAGAQQIFFTQNGSTIS